jgi:Kef-type K+ transport system membrane component KefB
MVQLVLQLAVIIFFAKTVGVLTERHLRQPAVLGELLVGVIIGPYALGSIPIPGLGPLFPLPHAGSGLPVTEELYGIATLASVVLLFLAGLETDLSTFLRFSLAGTVVGIGGIVFSFIFGDLLTVVFGFADSFMDPTALFMGTIATATSVGITARILSEKRKMDAPEGVTILAGAVIDDVLGIIVLAIVVGISKVRTSGGEVNWSQIGIIGAKALGFWIVATGLGLALSRRISSVLKWFRSRETMGAVSFGFALLLSGLAEKAGLAMIIGAYVMGLSLSRVDVAHELQTRLSPVYNLLVPVFFCVMGMLVDVSAMKGILLFGSIFTVVMILTKVLGCGAAALLVGFNVRGGARIGAGMLPRGEVALIVAGVGLAAGVVSHSMFGVAILMTLVTTLVAPPMLIQFLRGGSGLRGGEDQSAHPDYEPIVLEFPTREVADFMRSRILESFIREEFFVHRVDAASDLFLIQKDEHLIRVSRQGNTLVFSSRPEDRDLIRMFVLEEIVTLKELLSALTEVASLQNLSAKLLLSPPSYGQT